MWDLVGNPEDRFSHNEAHFMTNLNERMFASAVNCTWELQNSRLDMLPTAVTLTGSTILFCMEKPKLGGHFIDPYY